MPSREEIEAYLHELDEWAWRTLQAAAADIPSLDAIANRIWTDLGRFGPPQLPIPGLGVFDIPPNPPPPPPAPGLWENAGDWIVNNRWKAFGLGVCFVLGSGLLAGYASARIRAAKRRNRSRKVSKTRERKEVAVVLGADSALGFQLVLDLESRGFIVMATVSKSDAAEEIESSSSGYVRVLVLDASEPSSVSSFIRSLQTSLSLRFPSSVSGDPYYSSPSLHPHICTVISLLSLYDPLPPTPFEHLSLSTTYLSYLQRSHITPLQAIQNLLPLMRVPANSSTKPSYYKRKKKIIICVPVIASRVGVSWDSAQAMSSGATVKAADVLRRELRDSGQGNSISVTVADVGLVGAPSRSYNSGAAAYMSEWSSNIRSTYGPAFLGALEQSRLNPRSPGDVKEISARLVLLADEARGLTGYLSSQWRTCEREVMGAGAYTYALASKLPEWVLDGILSLPAVLVKVRNRYVPIVTQQPEPMTAENEEENEENEENEEIAENEAEEQAPDERDSRSDKVATASSGYSSEAELTGSYDKIATSWVSLNEEK